MNRWPRKALPLCSARSAPAHCARSVRAKRACSHTVREARLLTQICSHSAQSAPAHIDDRAPLLTQSTEHPLDTLMAAKSLEETRWHAQWILCMRRRPASLLLLRRVTSAVSTCRAARARCLMLLHLKKQAGQEPTQERKCRKNCCQSRPMPTQEKIAAMPAQWRDECCGGHRGWGTGKDSDEAKTLCARREQMLLLCQACNTILGPPWYVGGTYNWTLSLSERAAMTAFPAWQRLRSRMLIRLWR
jgi:hypothetical protein